MAAINHPEHQVTEADRDVENLKAFVAQLPAHEQVQVERATAAIRALVRALGNPGFIGLTLVMHEQLKE